MKPQESRGKHSAKLRFLQSLQGFQAETEFFGAAPAASHQPDIKPKAPEAVEASGILW